MRALSVGNSHSLAVDFNAMDVPGYHVWTRGQDLFEAEAQLRDLLPRLPNLEVVFFAVSYGSFRRDNGACDDEERGMVRSEWYASQPQLGMIGADVELLFDRNGMTRAFYGVVAELEVELGPAGGADVEGLRATAVVVPAFVMSEIRTAFKMGFLIFLPFILVDLHQYSLDFFFRK